MKKIIIFITQVFFILLVFSSCKKSYLDETLYSSYAPETLKDSLGFEASEIGLYRITSDFFTYSDNQGWPCVWQVGTDVAFATQPAGYETPYYNYLTLTASDGAAYHAWQWAYTLINNANIIINSIENSSGLSMTQKGKNAYDAEARFFRAYAYNLLATCFGKVPLVKVALSAPKTDFVRTSLDSVNALIVEDLTYASTWLTRIDSVKTNSSGARMYGRANKHMAMQLLAEVYLRMAERDNTGSASAYAALAETQCKNIINSGMFSLITSRYGTALGSAGDAFHDMFIYGNQRRLQGNTEALWVLEVENPSSVASITYYPQQRRIWGAGYYNISGMTICDSLGGRGICRLRLSNWVLYGLYDAGDMRNSQYNIRRHYWYNTPTSSLYGQPVPYTNSDTIYKICPHTTKWYQYDPNDQFGYGMWKDYILMRLGETYLLMAEAQFEQGNLSGAAATLTTLRARSNASAVTSSQVTLDYILDERARELVGEENRRMTLMRTGTLVTRAIKFNSNTVTYPLNGLTSTNLLLPIPQSEIDLNKDAVLTQNPGY